MSGYAPGSNIWLIITRTVNLSDDNLRTLKNFPYLCTGSAYEYLTRFFWGVFCDAVSGQNKHSVEYYAD
jgi:hypothetical protein